MPNQTISSANRSASDPLVVSKGTFKRFLKDTSASFAPMFGLVTIAAFLSAGAAVDYTQVSMARNMLNQAVDSAVLAAGNAVLEGENDKAKLRAIFDDYFLTNVSADQRLFENAVVKSFDVNLETGDVTANAEAPIELSFMGIVGKNEVTVDADISARFSAEPVEIAMVLDVTGSMGWSGKMDALKLAATDAVDLLLPEGKPNNNTRIGIVPYSAGVKLSDVLGEKATGVADADCMSERTVNPHNDAPWSVEFVGADPRTNCPSNRVRPLTRDGAALKGEITSFSPGGSTSGHLGIAWGYYMLSARWQDFWPDDAKPAAYDGKTRKIAIIMTDGEFNTYFNGFDDPVDWENVDPTRDASNNDARELCADMRTPKAGGKPITVYAVAFSAPLSAQETLKACATPDTADSTYYFDATSEEELRTAFREIAKDIKKLRLTR